MLIHVAMGILAITAIFGKFIFTIFEKIIFKPVASLASFIFHKIFFQGYFYYLALLKKIGWSKFKGTVASYVISQKIIHITIVVLTITISFTNSVGKTSATNLNDKAHKTIIAQFIEKDFSRTDEEDVLVEISFDEPLRVTSNNSYLNTQFLATKHSVGVFNDDDDRADLKNTISQDALIKPEIVETTITKRPRKEIVTHMVGPGDTISSIAYEYDISVNTVLWENNLYSWSVIRPGDKITILPFSGLIHKVIKGDTLKSISIKYDSENSKILEANKLANASYLQIGQKLLIPNGTKTRTVASPSVKVYTGFSAVKSVVTKEGKTTSGNKMLWPTPGHRITQYYSWRHHGLDIGDKTGTPLYAADTGTIEKIGWGRGYGNNIVIDHGGGKKTRYAHLSKFKVKKGQKIRRGEVIGFMGNTGWSTGPHLHFEVIINGKKYNPLNYIK